MFFYYENNFNNVSDSNERTSLSLTHYTEKSGLNKVFSIRATLMFFA